jgi:haloalkane dehalogenase
MPAWLDRSEYPFESHYLDLPMGRMHYVDEGSADHAVVMVHGNPAWSFSYRKLIKHLSPHYRCIAPDHIGFGLSEKPVDWDYLPEHQAANFEQLLDRLNPSSISLVVGDWGGPIGLSYALKHPEKVRSLIITNTWMWPVKGTFHYEAFSAFMGGPVGGFLIDRFNFFVTVLMKQMFRTRIDPAIHQHYVEPLSKPAERKGCRVFPREIIGSNAWLSQLWSQRSAITAKPALIVWGLQDIAFRTIELEQWKRLLTNAEAHTFNTAGHFVQEDLGDTFCRMVERHLDSVARTA